MSVIAPAPYDRARSIAIVGLAATFPNADCAEDLWSLLEEGASSVSKVRGLPSLYAESNLTRDFKVTPDRFDLIDGVYRATGLGSESCKLYGNFISHPDTFDNVFFHISPREAQSMDPQQRLLLQVAYRALENAGYTPDATPSWNRETFGTFIGVATHDYENNLRNDIGVYYSTGTFLGLCFASVLTVLLPRGQARCNHS